MIFNLATLRGIADGSITLTFRRWETLRVKVGSQQRTGIGVVEVSSLEPVGDDELTDADAAASGHKSVAEILKRSAGKDKGRTGQLYRVGLRLVGEDPRVRLREQDDLDQDAVADIAARLARMDKAAPEPWTHPYLETIRDQPGVVAKELAAGFEMPRDAFKIRVRRLKELGLTESLDVGYRLSPRGMAYLAKI